MSQSRSTGSSTDPHTDQVEAHLRECVRLAAFAWHLIDATIPDPRAREIVLSHLIRIVAEREYPRRGQP